MIATPDFPMSTTLYRHDPAPPPTITRFGDGYFADTATQPSWIKDADAFDRRLRPLMKLLGVDARHRVEQTVKIWRPGVHHRLRSVTQLGKGDGTGLRVVVETSDKVPPPVLARLAKVPDALLWVLLHRSLLARSRQGLELVTRNHELLVGLLPLPRAHPGASYKALEAAHQFLENVNDAAGARCDEEIASILQSPCDALGAYFFHRGRIELYWFVIWLIANELNVAVEDLTLVVLVHEMAHLYSHAGQDADGHDWDTQTFAGTELHIVEGLAQYYTEQVLDGVAAAGNPRPREAFEQLLRRQPPPYTCFRGWVPEHSKRSEVVRHAVVQTRTDGLKEIRLFDDLLRRHAAMLGNRKSPRRLFDDVDG